MMLISQRYKRVMQFVFCAILICLTMGCATRALNNQIQSKESGRTEYNSDKIVGLALGKDSSHQQGWVFIGEHFDYLLTSGGEGIVAMLKSKDIDRQLIEIRNVGQFYISKDHLSFSGNIHLNYNKRDINAKTKQVLEDNGFTCYGDNSSYGPCYAYIGNLKGSIHKKNKAQNNADILFFHKPFTVTFYADNGLSGARALYPVTIAIDVVTSPLQLLGTAIGLGIYVFGSQPSYH
ncbi:hypothetical protein ACU63M_06745 [Klebsiella aerogenes]